MIIIMIFVLTDSWKRYIYFNNSLLCKQEVSSATKSFLFLLKTHTRKERNTAAVDPRHLKMEVAD